MHESLGEKLSELVGERMAVHISKVGRLDKIREEFGVGELNLRAFEYGIVAVAENLVKQ